LPKQGYGEVGEGGRNTGEIEGQELGKKGIDWRKAKRVLAKKSESREKREVKGVRME